MLKFSPASAAEGAFTCCGKHEIPSVTTALNLFCSEANNNTDHLPIHRVPVLSEEAEEGELQVRIKQASLLGPKPWSSNDTQ